MRRLTLTLAALSITAAAPLHAQEATTSTAEQIDYIGFAELTEQVYEIRQERLLPSEQFFQAAHADGALLLDTRSAEAFAAGHLRGAVNLPFSDFTEGKLQAIIGKDTDRPIYIYCNNNFRDGVFPVRTKLAPLALNIPTFINLVGYGYDNVWELGEIVQIADVDWVGGLSQNQ